MPMSWEKALMDMLEIAHPNSAAPLAPTRA
jgi:hypothetical protein